MVFRSRVAGWAAAFLLVVFSLAVLPAATEAAAATGGKAYLTFGFLPTVSTYLLVKRFEPLTDYLSKKLGVEVRFETAPDYATFQRRTVTAKLYDFLYTAPHFYYLAQRDAGYRAVAMAGTSKLYAIIVVRKESPITSLKDLCGKKLTTPSRLALLTVLLHQTIAKIGCKKGKQVIILPTPTHNAALLNVYNRNSDAAGLGPAAFKLAAPAVRNSVRVIGRTGSTPSVPIAIAPWVDRKTAEKFTEIILSLKKTKEGRAIIKKTGWPGFKVATSREYDVMEPYAKFIKY
jgi:phosphonate transport system substrate-binding protein